MQAQSNPFTAWFNRAFTPLELPDFIALGKTANGRGESFLAFDIAVDGLLRWPQNRELRQVKALALARMGSVQEARDILSALREEGGDDEETAGMLARTYKDVWLRTESTEDLRAAYEQYLAAWRSRPERYWTAINTATLAFACRDTETALSSAREVRDTCMALLIDCTDGERYWITATLAEAALILATQSGDYREAEKFFRAARSFAGSNLGNVFSTWRNARIVLKLLPDEIAGRIETALDVPKIAVFAGHRFDPPGSNLPRFPMESAAGVKSAIRNFLESQRVRVGYSSAACGADLLFLEALQELGGDTQIVLPCSLDQFKEEQFGPAALGDESPHWLNRLENVLSRATGVTYTSRQRLKLGGVAYQYVNDVMDGLAAMRAAQFEASRLHVTVWDSKPGAGPGGTADITHCWHEQGCDVHVIDPANFSIRKLEGRTHPTSRHASSADPLTAHGAGAEVESVVGAMLFADAVHFSQLSEDQIPYFIHAFMGPITALVKEAEPDLLLQNTWGDGLFLVFRGVSEAARFAVRLASPIAALNRLEAHLPEHINLRIALHAGPIFRFQDQITNRANCLGSHVNLAARIESKTPAGQIYTTDLFAALATLETSGQFHFDYVGRVPLAKDFGEYALCAMRERR